MTYTTNAKHLASGRTKEKNMKKMGFFKRWLHRQIEEAQDYSELSNEIMPMVQKSTSIDNPDRALNFVVYTANGGRVIETRKYDRKNDRSYQNLYIITPEQDFGKEIDKIITMEALR